MRRTFFEHQPQLMLGIHAQSRAIVDELSLPGYAVGQQRLFRAERRTIALAAPNPMRFGELYIMVALSTGLLGSELDLARPRLLSIESGLLERSACQRFGDFERKAFF